MNRQPSRAPAPTPTAFSGIPNYRAGSGVPQIDYQLLSKTYFFAFSRYLTAYLAKAPSNSRSTARQKLVRLTIQQFHELSNDVYDELIRREVEPDVPFLPLQSDFHPKRNQARQKLATFPTSRFEDLTSDVHFELLRRNSGFKDNSANRRVSGHVSADGPLDSPSGDSMGPESPPAELVRLSVGSKEVNEEGDGSDEYLLVVAYILEEESLEEEPLENVKTLIARLTVVFENLQQYKQLLSYRDSQAQRLIDTFQMLLDIPGLSGKFRRNLLVAMQRLSRCAGLYPTCYNLKDIKLTSEHPVAAGSFADIYKGHLLGQVVCLKVIRLYQTSDVNSFLKHFSAEAILWGRLSHPNLLPIYGLYQYMGRPCLVAPWMEHGDINRYLERHPETNRTLLVSDVASGIAYLHKHDIIHGDLKGANTLIDDSGRACLADFGLAAVSDRDILHWTSHSSAASKGGSIRWQAPELFDTDNDEIVYNSKPSDVYAFSCLAYEIYTGNIPFAELPRDAAVMRKVQTGAQPSRPSASSLAWGPWGLTESHWTLMGACWRTNPDDRPTIHDIVALLKKPVDDRPVGNVDAMSPAQFRDSATARTDLPSVDEIEAMLDSLDLEAEGCNY